MPKTQVLTPVQAARREARVLAHNGKGFLPTDLTDDTRTDLRSKGREASVTLRGVTGLSVEDQVERLEKAGQIYKEMAMVANQIPAEVARDSYRQAGKVCDEAIELIKGRDNVAYQASKHQGAGGWLAHVTEAHGVPVDQLVVEDFAYAPDAEAEAAWSFHQGLEAHDH